MQVYTVLREVKGSVEKLSNLREKSKRAAFDYLTGNCKAPKEIGQRLDQTLEYFTIMPVDMDPNGLVGKVEHVVRLQDDRMRDEIRRMAPSADLVQVSVAQNILVVATSLNQLFKVFRQNYIQGLKT